MFLIKHIFNCVSDQQQKNSKCSNLGWQSTQRQQKPSFIFNDFKGLNLRQVTYKIEYIFLVCLLIPATFLDLSSQVLVFSVGHPINLSKMVHRSWDHFIGCFIQNIKDHQGQIIEYGWRFQHLTCHSKPRKIDRNKICYLGGVNSKKCAVMATLFMATDGRKLKDIL